ncbi:transcriptional regulator [Gordonia sp. (in: high G+C Gram-positive bacteria)]|uniref:transcriptional regulator n=1 Tax=Gordonia sp. (in: high G+C Gram-positive bacteria) TaxID=84139 RepID=UPI0016AA20D9|nr:transcriptional regulator [Gordonia sp. (in: high G+C Gram-positive bacteria)]NLG45409.1 transcriptional regulator [Gordonia sp. (in: high G+C Gram-positive bacteria)]
MDHSPSTPTRRHRPALIVLVTVAAVACMALAWWQWGRYESASGTGQNLGYALQWPAFAIAVVYAYRRFVVMEADPDAERTDEPTEIPAGVLPERPTSADPSVSAILDAAPDDDMAAYNRYLAELDKHPTHD